jgi:Na+/glutamate symporter
MKNISMIGRLLRIIFGIVMIMMAVKNAEKMGKKAMLMLIIAGFIGICQGYTGFCILRKLGISTPV